MRKVLILIPCCRSKQSGGITEYNSSSSILNYLTSSARKQLLSLRRELFEYFSFPLGQDVESPDDSTITYIEAYRRYTGKIYRQICAGSWQRLREIRNLDLVIISALFGLLRYDELIRYYNVNMNDKVGDQAVKAWWRENDLYKILKYYINTNNISEVHNVLSNDYNEALRY
ncbi:peroxide stress protein YaaA, partial [candidate division WOR-3 bacterium]|nr:peroxide stress protein YaaA [candidate division WOR-3 bacterium]